MFQCQLATSKSQVAEKSDFGRRRYAVSYFLLWRPDVLSVLDRWSRGLPGTTQCRLLLAQLPCTAAAGYTRFTHSPGCCNPKLVSGCLFTYVEENGSNINAPTWPGNWRVVTGGRERFVSRFNETRTPSSRWIPCINGATFLQGSCSLTFRDDKVTDYW